VHSGLHCFVLPSLDPKLPLPSASGRIVGLSCVLSHLRTVSSVDGRTGVAQVSVVLVSLELGSAWSGLDPGHEKLMWNMEGGSGG
jgi:hypothetical protein